MPAQRPWSQANKFKNGGFEDYGSIEFAGIANIHAVRASLSKMHQLYTGSRTRNFVSLRQVSATGWLQHVASILKGADRIVTVIDAPLGGQSVLVHCSDGWDRTPQLTSLAQLCLDPFYRTVDGFRTLVQKEWQSFGHKFRDRTWGPDQKQRSPVFLQFLDCVHQLMQQHPSAFEFNDRLLLRLVDFVYGQYANSCPDFLFDSESEARETGLAYTCWSYIGQEIESKRNGPKSLLNKNFESAAQNGCVVIHIREDVPLAVWSSFFRKWRGSPPNTLDMRPNADAMPSADAPPSDAAAPLYATAEAAAAAAAPPPTKEEEKTPEKTPEKTWDIDNPYFLFRALALLPLTAFGISAIAVAVVCVLGLLVNGRPRINAETTGFATARNSPAFNRENSMSLLLNRTMFYPEQFLIRGVPALASAEIVPTCSDCASEIQLTVRIKNSEGAPYAGNVLQADHLRALCALEDDILTMPEFSVACKSTGGQCCAPESLPRLLAAEDGLSCSTLTDEQLKTALAALQHCDSPPVPLVNLNSGSDTGSWTAGPMWPPPGWCGQNLTVSTRLVDHTFDGTTGAALSSRVCFRDSVLQPQTDNTAWFVALIHNWEERYPSLAITAHNDDIVKEFADQKLSEDLEITWYVVLLVGLLSVPLSGSLFPAIPALIQNLAAFLLAYAFYGIVFDIDWFPFTNYSALFIMWCMGTDENILIWDLWTQPPDCLIDTRLTWIWHRIFTPTLLANLVKAGAMGACVFSCFPAVRLFGMFMVMLIVFKYVLSFVFAPTILCVEHVTLRYMLSCCSCGCEGKHESAPRKALSRAADSVTCASVATISACRWPLLVILAALGVLGGWNAVVETNFSGQPFQLFSFENPFEEHSFSSLDFLSSPGADDMHGEGISVNMVWGLLPEDNGAPYETDPLSFGENAYDGTFDIADPEAQEWFASMSKTLRKQTWVRPDMPLNVFERFEAWLVQHGTLADLCYPGVGTELPVSADAFRACFTRFTREDVGSGLVMTTVYLPPSETQYPSCVLAMPVGTTMLASWDQDKMQSLIDEFDHFWTQVNMNVPATCGKGFFTSSSFAAHGAERELLRDVARTMVLSTLFLMVALLIGTHSITITALGLLSVLLAVSCSLGLIPAMSDQRFRDVFRRDDSPTLEIGILHSMSLPVLFGTCAHPIILLSYLYITAPVDPVAKVTPNRPTFSSPVAHAMPTADSRPKKRWMRTAAECSGRDWRYERPDRRLYGRRSDPSGQG